ncbi:hypothetical protein [Swinepox virus]|uniref:Uncharacterized protein n=1 Tax=Swinepox virus TaxID=10276 RepID=A0A881SXZ0_SWPV|nr:hypothetical protein [Swinepox virus]
MISVTSLIDAFNTSDNEDVSLCDLFRTLRINDAMRMIVSGIHPNTLPKKWYSEVVETLPHKLCLFKPKYTLFVDLLSVIHNQKNIEKYKEHINFHKVDILQNCTKDVIIKCISHMKISDDDIRYLRNRFYDKDVDEILVGINEDSIKTINYIFSNQLTENIFTRNYNLHDCLYKHQTYSSEFLIDMLYKYGIIPNNDGIIDELTIDTILDILQSNGSVTDTISFLDMLSPNQLDDDRLKNYIISKIHSGQIEQYRGYANEYLSNRIVDLGVYANIFFDCVDFSLVDYDDITKHQLVVICKYIDRYELYINYIINYLIKHDYIDLLSKIIKKIPKEIFTEELCIRIICDSDTKVEIKDLPIHSSLVMAMCIEMGYEDIVDLLDEIDIDILIEKKVDLITDYTFTTDWYNKKHELIKLFIEKYGFCNYKMNKLLFEYPLSYDSIKYLFDLMIKHTGSDLFYPTIVSSLFYLTCTERKIKIKKIPNKDLKIPCKKIPVNNNSIITSNLIHVRSTILYSNVPGIDISFLKNTCYIKDINNIYIHINPDDNILLMTEDGIIDQLYSIAKLMKYGLIYVPYKYFPSWIPVIDIMKGYSYASPSKIEHGVIYKIYPTDFVEYKSVGNYVSNIYALSEYISNYHAVINTIIQTLLLYIVVGSKYSTKNTDEYIATVINTLFTGMKINEILTEDITEVCKEINNIKSYICDSGFVFIKKNYLKNTLDLCEKVCVSIILDNN